MNLRVFIDILACVFSMLSSMKKLSCLIILDASPFANLSSVCLRINKGLSVGGMNVIFSGIV